MPGGGLVARGAEHDQAGATGDRGARPVGARQGRGHPLILLVAGQPPLQLTDVPGTRDVKGEPAAAELRPHVGDGGRREHRRPAAPEDLEVELERASEPGAREVAPASAVPQEGVVLLQGQREQRLDLVERQQHRVPVAPAFRVDRGQHALPLRPRHRRRGEPRARQPIGAEEHEPRVHVPRDTVQRAVDPVGVPDAGEVVVRADDRGGVGVAVERFERVQRVELGDPRVAELADVGGRVAGERGEQLLVRGGPRQLLDLDADARIGLLELGK